MTLCFWRFSGPFWHLSIAHVFPGSLPLVYHCVSEWHLEPAAYLVLVGFFLFLTLREAYWKHLGYSEYLRHSVSIAVKRHHGQGSSYKGKHLMGWLMVSEFSPLSCGTQADLVLEIELEIPAFWPAFYRYKLRPEALPASSDTLRPTRPYLLQKSHTSK